MLNIFATNRLSTWHIVVLKSNKLQVDFVGPSYWKRILCTNILIRVANIIANIKLLLLYMHNDFEWMASCASQYRVVSMVCVCDFSYGYNKRWNLLSSSLHQKYIIITNEIWNSNYGWTPQTPHITMQIMSHFNATEQLNGIESSTFLFIISALTLIFHAEDLIIK